MDENIEYCPKEPEDFAYKYEKIESPLGPCSQEHSLERNPCADSGWYDAVFNQGAQGWIRHSHLPYITNCETGYQAVPFVPDPRGGTNHSCRKLCCQPSGTEKVPEIPDGTEPGELMKENEHGGTHATIYDIQDANGDWDQPCKKIYGGASSHVGHGGCYVGIYHDWAKGFIRSCVYQDNSEPGYHAPNFISQEEVPEWKEQKLRPRHGYWVRSQKGEPTSA